MVDSPIGTREIAMPVSQILDKPKLIVSNDGMVQVTGEMLDDEGRNAGVTITKEGETFLLTVSVPTANAQAEKYELYVESNGRNGILKGTGYYKYTEIDTDAGKKLYENIKTALGNMQSGSLSLQKGIEALGNTVINASLGTLQGANTHNTQMQVASSTGTVSYDKPVQHSAIKGQITNSDFVRIMESMIRDEVVTVVGQTFDGRAQYDAEDIKKLYKQIPTGKADDRARAILGYASVPGIVPEQLNAKLLRLTGNEPLSREDIQLAKVAESVFQFSKQSVEPMRIACSNVGGDLEIVNNGLECVIPKSQSSRDQIKR